jgi:hypothetical protein
VSRRRKPPDSLGAGPDSLEALRLDLECGSCHRRLDTFVLTFWGTGSDGAYLVGAEPRLVRYAPSRRAEARAQDRNGQGAEWTCCHQTTRLSVRRIETFIRAVWEHRGRPDAPFGIPLPAVRVSVQAIAQQSL